MRNITKKLLPFVLVLVIACGVMPFTANAASTSTEAALRTNVAKGGSHKLTKDIELSDRLVIPAGKTVTLDLNGKKLSRSLSEAKDDGSVIFVEEGAELTVTDTSTKREGCVTGGFSVNGGGIRNHGKFTLTGGSIVGNSASGCGGGIYNAPEGELILSGGAVSYNRAGKGGGVYNDLGGGALTIAPSVQTMTVSGTQKKVECSVTMTGNTADKGGALYTFNSISMSGAPVLSGNNADADIALHGGYLPRIICGTLTYETPVGVAYDDVDGEIDFEFTQSFGANNTENGERFFCSAVKGVNLHATMFEGKPKELKLLANSGKTVVEAYDHGKLIFSQEYDKPEDAWKASQAYWKQCLYYFEDAETRKNAAIYLNKHPDYNTSKGVSDWNLWLSEFSLPYAIDYWTDDNLKRDGKGPYDDSVKQSYRYWDGHLQDDYQVKITLGSDWKLSDRLLIWHFRNIILDLNGHYIDRGGKKAKNGMVFYLEEFSKLTVLDSNPDSDGYNGFKGGVIANGNGDDKGGGFVLDDQSELVVLGGTVYNCKTDDHGGGVTAGEPRAKITLKNCTFYHCYTKDSGDDCNGGAVWIKHTLSTTMENVTFDHCESEDNGGAIYITNRPGEVRLTNCTFKDNYANNYGGAIQIKGIDDKKLFFFEAVGCTFIDNHCADDGGAVCVSDNDDSVWNMPILFRDCVFEGNVSDRDGSAFEIDDDSVALINCTITGNTAKGKSAVYVNNKHALSLGGKTVIRDNVGQDVILDSDSNKTLVYSTGLTEGSDIRVGVIGGDNTIALKDIPEGEMKYFSANGNYRLEYRKTGDKTANLVMGSIFGNGLAWVVIGIVGAAVIAAVTIVIVKKKKNGRRTEENA